MPQFIIWSAAIAIVAVAAYGIFSRGTPDARGAISFVQSASSSYYGAGSTSLSGQFTGSVGAGHLVAVTIAYSANNNNYYGGTTNEDPVTGCSDNVSSTYFEAVDSINGNLYTGIDVWYAMNVAGTSTLTVTCTFNQSIGAMVMGLGDYSGVATSSALETVASINNSPTSTSWTSGYATTQSSGDLIIGGFEGSQSGISFTAGSGYTLRVNQGASFGFITEDGIQASAGSVAATASSASGVPAQENVMAAFRPASAPLPSGVRWIQSADNHISNGVNPTVTFKNPVVASDTLVVGLTYGDDDGGITGCSDSNGNSFTLAVATNSVPAYGAEQIFYATNVKGGANDTITCTVRTGDTIYAKMLIAAEYAGVAPSSALDATSAYFSSATTTTFTTGTATTTSNGDLIFAMITHLTNDNTAILTPGSGYTMRETISGSGAEDMIQASSGPVSATAINSESDTFIGLLAAFKSAAGAADTSPPTQPTNVGAVANSFTKISLSWAASTDNVGVTGYKILRGGTQVGTSTVASYTDTGVSPGTAYSYTIQAFDAAGNTSTVSSAAAVTTPVASSGASYVQGADANGKYNENLGAYSSVSATFPGAVTAGNAIVAVVQYQSPSQDIVSSCSDTQDASSTYKEAARAYNSSLGQGVDVWYATGVAGGATTTVTCAFTNYATSHGWVSMTVQEYQGIAASAAFDATSTYDSEGTSSSAWSVGPLTTTAPGDLVFAAFMDPYISTTSVKVSTTTFSPGSSFLMRMNDGMSTGLFTEDMTFSATGTVSATATASLAWPQTAVLLALKSVTSSYYGTLDSMTYDTGVAAGAQLNSVEWTGTLQANTTVEFQFAVGNTPTGTWTTNFFGNDGTSNSYFYPALGPGSALPLMPASLFTNYRYFRYRIFLYGTASTTPTVNSVIVGWSP